MEVENPKKLVEELREACKPAETQLLRAEHILNPEHVYFAVFYALEAFKQKANIARTLNLEILLKAAAEDQIREALSKIGLKKGRQDIVALTLAENQEEAEKAARTITERLAGHLSPDILKPTPSKLESIARLFDITEERLKADSAYPDKEKALLNLIIEEIALTLIRR